MNQSHDKEPQSPPVEWKHLLTAISSAPGRSKKKTM